MSVADLRFAAVHNRERDVNALSGLIRGIALDGHIKPSELNALFGWCAGIRIQHNDIFDEAISRIEAAASDGVLDEEEREDLLHFCERLSVPASRVDQFSRDMQVLHGLLAGVAADGVIVEQEIKELRRWLDGSTHLKGVWPYDEIDSLIASALHDGHLDESEQRFLMAFTSQFLDGDNELRRDTSTEALVKYGICAVKPAIDFAGNVFVVTGESSTPRTEIHEEIERRGGIVQNRVTDSTNLLVVCADGSPAWAFSCYGRKIEQAMNLRKHGARITIVHETDFWARIAEVAPTRDPQPKTRKGPRKASAPIVMSGTSVNGAIRTALEKLLASAPDDERRTLYSAALSDWANQNAL